MATANSELVVSIQEVQLHKVHHVRPLTKSSYTLSVALDVSALVQVEGGQENLLEWAPFSIELVNTGNDSELVASVSSSYM